MLFVDDVQLWIFKCVHLKMHMNTNGTLFYCLLDTDTLK